MPPNRSTSTPQTQTNSRHCRALVRHMPRRSSREGLISARTSSCKRRLSRRRRTPRSRIRSWRSRGRLQLFRGAAIDHASQRHLKISEFAVMSSYPSALSRYRTYVCPRRMMATTLANSSPTNTDRTVKFARITESETSRVCSRKKGGAI